MNEDQNKKPTLTSVSEDPAAPPQSDTPPKPIITVEEEVPPPVTTEDNPASNTPPSKPPPPPSPPPSGEDAPPTEESDIETPPTGGAGNIPPVITPPEPKSKIGLVASIIAVLLLVISIPTGIFLVSQRQELREKAAAGRCRDNPETPPPGYKWKALCDKPCTTNADCPRGANNSEGWCYGFEGATGTSSDWRCLQLEVVGIPSAADGPGGCCDPGAADNSANGCRVGSGYNERCDISNGACQSGFSCRSLAGCTQNSDCGPGNQCVNGRCQTATPTPSPSPSPSPTPTTGCPELNQAGTIYPAVDGQSLATQPCNVVASFVSSYGSQAGSRWAREHNLELGCGGINNCPAAKDGRKLSDESDATIASFMGQWWKTLGNQTGFRWMLEHNLELTCGTPIPAANDGQTLRGQPSDVISTFLTLYGANACREWVSQHNATDVAGRCQEIKVYDLGWRQVTPSNLKDGDRIRIAVRGSGAVFDQARIRVHDGTAWTAWMPATRREGTDEFYLEYTIHADRTRRFEIQAQVHHQAGNVWF